VALFGAGWALAVCGVGMFATVPLLLAIKVAPLERAGLPADAEPEHVPSMLRDLRDGWSEFRSHTWLWATVLQFFVVLAAWCGGFQVLGPAVANAHLGGAAAWGLISAAEATGLIAGGFVALRWTPRRPMLFIVACGAAIALSPLSLAMLLPLWQICAISFVLGVAIEWMSVVWTVTMATRIPTEKLARVSAYDGLGTTMGMPVGALVAGPLAARIGVSATQYGAAAITLLASLLTLIARDVRTMRADSIKPVPVDLVPVGREPAELVPADLVSADLVSAAPVPVVPAEPASQAAC
jgi:predicted MFS family arabinose efflux permease